MPFNGAGVFNRIYSWVTDAANGLNVDATRMDTDTDDIADGLSQCITTDGQSAVTANIPFNNKKLTLVGMGSAATDAFTMQNANSRACEGRLTLTTSLPVTISDVTSATTVYFTPYKGNNVAVYDGTNWVMRQLTELTIDVTALSASKVYDVFVYDNAGALALETVVWTNDTTRATALAFQDGVYVKSGTVTRRYVGSFRTDASTRANDSYALRHVWNYQNRVVRPMRVTEATDSWTYTTATFRQARASAANQLDFLVGVGEDEVNASVRVFGSNTNANVLMIPAIGLDSTSAVASGCLMPNTVSQVAGQLFTMVSDYKTIPAAGRHTLVWLEWSTATGTSTWYGDAGTPSGSQSGIHGSVMA